MNRVRVLLRTHDEPYDRELSRPERSATGFSEPRKRRYTCGECGGAGCERCGAIRAQAALDGVRIGKGRTLVEERDAYDDGPKGFWATTEAKTMTPRQVERALDNLREDALKRAGVIADIEFEATLEQAERRDARGSYQELRVALDFMPPLRGAAAVRWLAENIPGPIRVPRWAYEQELADLEEEILRLKGHGWSRQEIAAYLAVSQRQVKSALRRARPAA